MREKENSFCRSTGEHFTLKVMFTKILDQQIFWETSSYENTRPTNTLLSYAERRSNLYHPENQLKIPDEYFIDM